MRKNDEEKQKKKKTSTLSSNKTIGTPHHPESLPLSCCHDYITCKKHTCKHVHTHMVFKILIESVNWREKEREANLILTWFICHR